MFNKNVRWFLVFTQVIDTKWKIAQIPTYMLVLR